MRLVIFAVAPWFLIGCVTVSGAPRGITTLSADAVLERSRHVFEAERTGDKAALTALLSDNYVYLSSVGNVDRPKAEEIALQSQVTVQSYSIEKARVLLLGSGTALLRYFVHQRLLRRGKAAICPYSGAVELWQAEHGQLRMVTRTEWLVGTVRAPPCQ